MLDTYGNLAVAAEGANHHVRVQIHTTSREPPSLPDPLHFHDIVITLRPSRSNRQIIRLPQVSFSHDGSLVQVSVQNILLTIRPQTLPFPEMLRKNSASQLSTVSVDCAPNVGSHVSRIQRRPDSCHQLVHRGCFAINHGNVHAGFSERCEIHDYIVGHRGRTEVGIARVK